MITVQLPDGTIHGAAAMEWQGAQGVYAKCWAGVAEAANDSPTIKILAWLTTLQINTLKNWDACSVVFFTPDGGFRKGIIKQLQVRARVRPQTRYESEIEILEL